MSTYAQFDEVGEQYQVASNTGWSEFGDWCESLDAEQFPNVVQLFEHGVTEDLRGLASELLVALEENSPDEKTMGVVNNLLEALKTNEGAGAILITSGITPDDPTGS